MLLFDFIDGIKKNGGDIDFAYKIVFLLVENAPEENISDTNVDDAVFDKVILMMRNSVPEETIYTVMQNSLDWYRHLDVKKFWRELGVWRDKLGLSKEEIKQDIKNYENNVRTGSNKIPLVATTNKLIRAGLEQDFVVHKLSNYIVDDETAENDVHDIYANVDTVDTILRMHKDGWAEGDMIRELEKQVDRKSGIDTRKFSRSLPKDFVGNERKISAKDGTIKYTSPISFLKYINPVLKFFTEKYNQIAELSKKYQNDNEKFAHAFYELYVNFRGWGNLAPELICDFDKYATKRGGFAPEGKVILRNVSSQEKIVNTIIHELMHFEQYLMLINTPDIGIMPYVKEHIMQGMLTLSKSYEQYDKKNRIVLSGEDFQKFDSEDMPLFISVTKQHLENDFYHNALKIPHEKITPESPKYAIIKKLADSHMMTYDNENRGNMRFVYPNLFAEQMAYPVGNAAAVMFRNIVKTDENQNLAEFKNILEVATLY